MKKLSTGHDNTLESWIALSTMVFGEDSAQVKFLRKKADESPNGVKERVIADERQLLFVLANLER